MILAQLGKELGVAVHGNEKHEVLSLAPIDSAGPQDLSFVVSRQYTAALKASAAGVVIVPESMLPDAPGNALVSDNPYACYARASWILNPQQRTDPGVHDTAVVHPTATVSSTASVGAFCVIGAHSVVADEAVIESHSTLGSGVSVGARSKLFARVSVYDNVSMGVECRVQSGAVLGSEGFGYAWRGNEWSQIQQVGGLRIGDNVHIGANTTIDCGAIKPTVIESGVILDNQIQIAHNVHIGKNTAIAGCVGIAGSTRIGSHCQIGGACNIVGHISIADHVVVNAASLVTRSITEKGRYGSGMPLQEERAWRRSFVNLVKLDGLFRRTRQLEQQFAARDDQDQKSISS